MTVNKCWQSEDEFGAVGDLKSTGELSFICLLNAIKYSIDVVHAGSVNGFVENAALIFRAGTATGDYHGQMNKDNFERWLFTNLFPNIPTGSVIVMDNAPYHSELKEKVPTKYSTKQAMITWLQYKNLQHDPSSRKADLFEIISQNRPTEKSYRIDDIIRSNGHIPLRTPPYMCELNSLELAWSKMKRFVREHNTKGGLNLKDLLKLTQEGLAAITSVDWEGYCKHVLDIENRYWETDGRIEEITDVIIINLGEDDSEEEDNTSTSSSSEDECSGERENDDDMEGVEPLQLSEE